MNKAINLLKRSATNIPGWRTNRKIVVIESDDWGSIRMPSREVYNMLLKGGIRVDLCPYNRFDSLASEDDLSALFEVLTRFRDKNGNHPVITANTVVANPDFEKIKTSEFEKYHYEPFTETLKKYPAHKKSFELWKQGIKEKVFHPQFHGREHVNVPLWLELLKQNHPVFFPAFENQLWGLGRKISNTGKISIQAAYDTLEPKELEKQKNAIKEGLILFEDIFGYSSESFIANNFIWDPSINSVLSESGISILQGMKYQKLPLLNTTKRKMIRHYTGKINKLGQVYLVRNCVFEPSQYPNIDSVTECLKDISNAFFWKKPAIITSHRLNCIGFIDPVNRDKNLFSFKKLLASILKNWPEVEFMTSSDLGRHLFFKKPYSK